MSVTSIEWTKRPGTIGEVWNPTTGCNKVDRGCKNCYAEIMHKRLQAMGQVKYAADFLDGAKSHRSMLLIPLSWNKPRTVFVNSMSDLFHKDVPFEFIWEVFETMQVAAIHTFLILTKRPERAVEFWEWCKAKAWDWACPQNVWMGTSVNDQPSANKRIPLLLQLDGCLRFLSYEPATGPVDLTRIVTNDIATDETGKERLLTVMDVMHGLCGEMAYKYDKQLWAGKIDRDQPRLHWVIMGGESGPKADPMHPAWARAVRDACKSAGVPFFFKQHGTWAPINYRHDNQEIYIKFNLGKNEYLFADPPQNMVKLGKHATGHELDGVAIQQFPQTQLP